MRPSLRPPAMHRGNVIRHSTPLLVLDLPGGDDFTAGEDLLLVWHAAGVRVAGAGRLLSVDGPSASIETVAEWRQVDARRDFRFPARHAATVRFGAEGPSEAAPATVTDISLGGLGLLVAAPPPATPRALVTLEGASGPLPCIVVGADQADSLWLLHLAFGSLDPEQRAFVATLVDHYRTRYDADRKAA